MPTLTAADTIRILVATDSHVGYNERDAIRGDDSWKSFHEVMCLAKEQDVDMILLAGDLFHDNKPSRKSMYQVMRSLRMNCYGEKPCELEMLSDGSETFQGAFNHVNYEDPDINVAIPVFSIHGNHDDPSGEGHLAALDLLQISGLVNYYGRTPESDNILVKPVLLQKGHTKLALYGMSNVRDERLFRTFRDGRVKFFQPGTQKQDWFNLMSVHQNHHAYTETGYLPENFLPEFLDFVIWGHEHECLIDPTYNPEMNFHVMQPGSSVATSLMPGEAVPKHVAVLSVTGRDFKVETIRLKTVRPFVMKEIILSEEKEVRNLSKKGDNRSKLTQYLIRVVEGLIEQAKTEWLEAQDEVDPDEEIEIPLPLIRLRIEYSAPDGGTFECENPQRFSNRFVNKVANVNDVVQFYRKKAGSTRKAQNGADMPEESILAQLSIDSVKVEKLVREFLTAQSLTILPQNSFGDAVSQFVDKDDKHAMEMFVNESLSNQIKHLMDVDHMDEDDIMNAMDQQKSKLEELFAAGYIRKTRKAKLKPRPDTWDSDLDGGAWEDQPGALIHSDVEADEDEDEVASLPSTKTKGRGKATAPKKNATAAKKAAPAKKGRGKKTVVEEESEEEDSDVVMMDSDEDESQLFVKQAPAKQGAKITAPAKKSVSPVKRTATRAARNISARQMKLDFSQPMTQSSQVKTKGTNKKAHEVSEDEISDDDDDDDAFAPPPPNSKSTRSRR
ncbi:meiotic recombination [Toensbergia leucococca]|nr:meiotic recombination [Toensbergia leucococca]